MRMHYRSARLLACIVLAVALTGCSRKEGPEGTGEDAATATPPEPTITEVETGRRVTSAHQVEEPVTSFAPTDTIWASVETRDTPAGTRILARWVYTEGTDEQVIGEETLTTANAGTGYTSFFVANPEPWPEGDYEVRIGIGSEVKETKTFSVKG